MKIAVTVLLLLFPAVSLAQDYQNYQSMNEQDMQQMMQQARKMQECMQNVDQEKLNELQKKSEQMNAELEALCAEGKRDEAQAKAIAFGQEFVNDPTMQQMSECSKLMEGSMPQMSTLEQYKEEDYANRHVCDEVP